MEQLNIEVYERLLRHTKLLLDDEIYKDTIETVLDYCKLCLKQCVEHILNTVASTDFNVSTVVQYVEDATLIIQLLSQFLQKVIVCVRFTYNNMYYFPTTTGQILMLVFTHCKNSEIIYGQHINCLKNQLMQLFRHCQGLQIIYFEILQKHYVFNLSKQEQEPDILIEALDINIKIGELVQSLDIKTMFDQWKGVTDLCGKYYDYLSRKHFYSLVTQVLCKMTIENLNITKELDCDDKVATRSLKVAGFTLNILLNISHIFRNTVDENYFDNIVELQLYIKKFNNESIEKFQPYRVISRADAILQNYVLDPKFLNCILQYEISELTKADKLYAYIILVVSIMDTIVRIESEHLSLPKDKIIDKVFQLVSRCPSLFTNWKTIETASRCSVYEWLLKSVFTFALTLNTEQYNSVERNMFEAIVGIESYSATFSSDLWVLLARSCPQQLLYNQLILLCGYYRNLENHYNFAFSPQNVHLSSLIKRLFKELEESEKIGVYQQFSIRDERNIGIWCALEVARLPHHVRVNEENAVMENCRRELHKLVTASVQSSDEMRRLIKTLKLASTCSEFVEDSTLECYIVKAWSKLCINKDVTDDFRGSHLCLQFIDALSSLTRAMSHVIVNNTTYLVKILHVISNLIETRRTEFIIIIELLGKLLTYYEADSKSSVLVDNSIMKILGDLVECDDIVVDKTLSVVKNCTQYKNFTTILENLLQNDSFKCKWTKFLEEFNENTITYNIADETENVFVHKCNGIGECDGNPQHSCDLSNNGSTGDLRQLESGNFDLVDIDNIFGAENDSEPNSKRMKMESNEVENVISELEKNIAFLNNVKENLSKYKDRLKKSSESLINIID